MSTDSDSPAPAGSVTAHLVLERRDGPQGRGFVYVAETNDQRPIALATSTTFYPELDLAAGEAALHDLIAQLERDGWQQEPTGRLTVVGMRFRRR
jgi:hypothetical protein